MSYNNHTDGSFHRYGDLSEDVRRLLFPASICLPIALIGGALSFINAQVGIWIARTAIVGALVYALAISGPAVWRLSRKRSERVSD